MCTQSVSHCVTILSYLSEQVVETIPVFIVSGLDVTMEWGVLLTQNSDLEPETDYPDCGLSWYSLVLPGECLDRT